MLVLCLSISNTTIAHVLVAKTDHVLASACCVQKQRHRQSRFRPHRVPVLEFLDLVKFSRMKAFADMLERFHAEGRIMRGLFFFDSPREQSA